MTAQVQPTRPCPLCAETILVDAKRCKHCQADLTAGASDGNDVQAFMLVALPLAAAALIWYWVGAMTLLDRPWSKLVGIVAGTVVVSAMLALGDAANLRSRRGETASNTSPGTWFVFHLLLWVVAYPSYLFQRRGAGARGLGWFALISMVIFGAVAVLVGGAILRQEHKLASVLQELRDPPSSDGPSFAAENLGSAPPSAAAAPPAGWQTGRSTSQMDDSSSPYIVLRADEPLENQFGRASYPTFFIRCRNDTTEAYVTFGTMLKSEVRSYETDESYGYSTGVQLRLRLENDPPTSNWAAPSDDSEAAFLRGPIPELQKMFGHTSLRVEAPTFTDGSKVARFSITGLESAIGCYRARLLMDSRPG